jgi:hypothetical protein
VARSGLRTWPHVTLAALGARVAGRSVKVVLSEGDKLTNSRSSALS